MKAEIGPIQIKYSARFRPTYSLEVSHAGLKKHRLIQDSNSELAQKKAFIQASEWEKKWEKLQNGWDKKEEAQFLTKEAQNEINQLNLILHQGLLNKVFCLNHFKDTSTFQEPKPIPLPLPNKPIFKEIPLKPINIPLEFEKPNIFLNLFPWLKRKIIDRQQKAIIDHESNFKRIYEDWEKEKSKIENENKKIKNEYDSIVNQTIAKNEWILMEWCNRRMKHKQKQREINEPLDKLQVAYAMIKPDAIVEFFTKLLDESEYPDNFPKENNVEYFEKTKTLLIDYALPSPTAIPTLKEVKYIQTRNEFAEYHITPSQHAKLYDDVLYQITLRTKYEIFKADKIESVEAIVFNGRVRSIDRRTGKETNSCIMSLQVKRNEFMEINLSNVEPKLCFKALKGNGSSKLHSLVGITPILQTLKPDSRFVESYDVTQSLDDTYNLAIMDWEDFEHLIRELFEKEFSCDGSEVKVTRASRDGGVDAIIFNPDPIHGGKTVVQAKRYTNTVGVSAVRDLYGTVLNEGANKGILVTTSDFGPDSYNFANGKPLTLINGGHLLNLLENHGHKARINLKEAKS